MLKCSVGKLSEDVDSLKTVSSGRSLNNQIKFGVQLKIKFLDQLWKC